MSKTFLFFIFIFFNTLSLFAQTETNETDFKKEKSPTSYDNIVLITPTYAFHLPAAEMAHRFGVSHSIGMSIDYKFGKNWSVGGEGNFIFGSKVKENGHFNNIFIGDNGIVNTQGGISEINLSERGAMGRFTFGKSFPFQKSQPNSGLLVKFGAGYLMHKILIDTQADITPQLDKNYQKGYDRLSHGITFSQFIGLIKLEKGKFVNLYLGIEAVQGITKNARPWDFYQGEAMDKTRFDMMIGIKMGWMIPVFVGESTNEEFYYY